MVMIVVMMTMVVMMMVVVIMTMVVVSDCVGNICHIPMTLSQRRPKPRLTNIKKIDKEFIRQFCCYNLS